jgi:outer membrane protein TolC
VGIGIKWTVFDANESRLKSQQSLIEGQKYQQQLQEADEMIALSVVKAQLTYEASLQNTEIILKEIELAEDTYKMIDKQYRNSLTSIKEVLDALNDLEKANFKLQQSYFDQRRAVANLLFAKGALTY